METDHLLLRGDLLRTPTFEETEANLKYLEGKANAAAPSAAAAAAAKVEAEAARDAANTSKIDAAQSKSDSASSAVQAVAAKQVALDASATATAQAGTATSQAATATAQATTATTQAGIATTQASIATTKAGEASASAAAAAAANAAIANGTATDAGTLTGAEIAPVSRGAGLLKTTLTVFALWVIQTFAGFIQAGVGAIARAILDKLRERISVDDFIPAGANAAQTVAGIQAALDRIKALGGGTLKFTGGKIYYIDNPITLTGDAVYWNVRFGIELETGAIVRATSGMTGKPMFVLTADSATRMSGFEIHGKGEIDCANYATKGVWVKTGARGFLKDFTVRNPTLMGIHVGDPASPSGGSEVHCFNVQPWRDEGANNDPNSIGIFYEVITDSSIRECHPVGFRTGIKTITNIRITDCHPWAKIGHGPMRYAFWVEGANSVLTACYADTPHSHNFDGSVDASIPDVYGFFLNGYGINLVSPVVYLEQSNAVDNVATGIWINHTDGLFGTIEAPTYGGGTTIKFKRYIGQLGQTTRLTNTTQVGAVTGGTFAYDSNNMSDYLRGTLILAGSALLRDGTASQPAQAFNSEENSGLYRAAAGDIRYSVLGQDVIGFNANTVFQRNGTNPQAHTLYNTYTDASNYERGFFRWVGNVLQVGTENAGTGQTREMRFYTNGQQRIGLSGSGALYPITSNTIDLGFASNAYRTYYGAGGMTLGAGAAKTADYMLTANDYAVRFDASGAARTATLPASPNTGQIYVVKKIDSSGNTVTVAGNGKTIDGASSVGISAQWGIWRGQYNGATWDTL